MNSLRTRLVFGGAGIAVVAIATWGYRSAYSGPKGALVTQLAAARENAGRLEEELDGQRDLRRRIDVLAATTLGTKFDILEHRLRTGLSRVAEREGLSGVVVTNGQPQEQSNQALIGNKKVQPTLRSQLRRSPDFAVVRGSVKGTGTLEQVLRAMGAVQAQAWVHRVESVSIRPSGKDRERFEVFMDVATVFAPGLGGRDAEPVLADAPRELEPAWRAVASKNVFRKPPAFEAGAAPPVRVAAPGGAALGPVFAPYEDWKLRGIVVGRRGAEAMFENTRTNVRLTVQKGGLVEDAVFVDGAGERAVIEIGGKRFELSNGQTLAARRPLG